MPNTVTYLSVDEWEAEAQRMRDAEEWRELEEAREAEQTKVDRWGNRVAREFASGVKHSDTAHPSSYRADLPLRSELHISARGNFFGTLTAASLAKITRTDKQERAELAARPLSLNLCIDPPRSGSYQMSDEKAIERARKRFAELSILPTF